LVAFEAIRSTYTIRQPPENGMRWLAADKSLADQMIGTVPVLAVWSTVSPIH
jgi:hypothetical protein